jgi:hypothetical protein
MAKNECDPCNFFLSKGKSEKNTWKYVESSGLLSDIYSNRIAGGPDLWTYPAGSFINRTETMLLA